MKTRLSALALALLAASLCGCNNESKSTKANADSGAMTASAPVNTTCPFSGNKANSNVTVAYNDKQVAFCCNGCKGRFNKMTEDQKAAMVNKIASVPN